jgi:exopolyphosphatase/guanosine-5'-triphosphate,3'-diphosphate pyrophosphatase
VQTGLLSELLGPAAVPASAQDAGGEGARESIERGREKHARRLERLVSDEGDRIERDGRRLLRRLDGACRASRRLRRFNRAKGSSRFLDAARAPLSGLVRAASAAAEADLTESANLHELRLACKRVRYGLEVFAGCFPQEVGTELYPGLVELQDRLGAATDAEGLAVRLSRLLERGRKDDPEAGEALAALAERCRALHEARAGEARAFVSTRGLAVVRRLERVVGGALQSTERDAETPEPLPPPIVVTRVHTPTRSHEPQETSRMAVIDVGTNSIRLEIVEAFPDRTYRVLDDEKETARLGAGMLRTGELTPEAMERAVQTIARMAAIAEGHKVPRGSLRAIGTYAVRASKNRDQFLAMVRERTGIEVSVLGPEQEGKLAFASADHAFDLGAVTSAVVDVGGGSTEVVLSASGVPEQVYGLPLGAMLLTEKFGGATKASVENFSRLRRHIDRVLDEQIGRPLLLPQLVVGTGGTFSVLANVLNAARGGGPQLWDRRVGFEATRSEIKHLIERVRRVAPAERGLIAGLPADRADIIVAGFAIVERVLKHLKCNAARVHDRGVRDGVILSMIGEAVPHDSPGADPIAAARRFAQKCNYEQPHSEHVTRLALDLYDQLAERLASSNGEREPWATPESRRLLEAGALLHDIGYLVSYSGHHKHSYHLILHSELTGPGLFSAREVELIANIARYHRRAEPRRAHRPFDRLNKAERRLVRQLAGVLRIADGLDRTHTQRVSTVRVEPGGDELALIIRATGDAGADLWGAAEKRGLLERAFGVRCHLRVERDEAGAATAIAAAS